MENLTRKYLDDISGIYSDWEEAFKCAMRDEVRAIPVHLPTPEAFGHKDVDHVEGMFEGENDGDSWRIYGRLKDGRWFYLEAWCDYTGWG